MPANPTGLAPRHSVEAAPVQRATNKSAPAIAATDRAAGRAIKFTACVKRGDRRAVTSGRVHRLFVPEVVLLHIMRLGQAPRGLVLGYLSLGVTSRPALLGIRCFANVIK